MRLLKKIMTIVKIASIIKVLLYCGFTKILANILLVTSLFDFKVSLENMPYLNVFIINLKIRIYNLN